uniref:Uncharacterized protein n=1 Tax=Mesocestoides corti TaxID=53468 RepID=A0A5K3F3M1_MESCO
MYLVLVAHVRPLASAWLLEIERQTREMINYSVFGAPLEISTVIQTGNHLITPPRRSNGFGPMAGRGDGGALPPLYTGTRLYNDPVYLNVANLDCGQVLSPLKSSISPSSLVLTLGRKPSFVLTHPSIVQKLNHAEHSQSSPCAFEWSAIKDLPPNRNKEGCGAVY